jgi:hypothetical protein
MHKEFEGGSRGWAAQARKPSLDATAGWDMVRLLRTSGFEIEDLIEIQAPYEVADAQAQPYVPLEWARR